MSTARGILLGAGLMYFLDPARGRRRRARMRDLVQHLRSTERSFFGKATRDASYRMHGLVERLRHPPDEAVPDAVLDGRVRARLGRVVSHPGAIEIGVNAGVVVLRGPVLEPEAAQLIHDLKRIPGVREVVDGLERHTTSDGVPALQGEARPTRSDLWSPAARGLGLVAGSALVGWGLATRHLLAIASGALLALRGGLNKSPRQLVGYVAGRPGIDVHKTIAVQAPIERVFELWSRFAEFPKFMEHVRDVQVQDPECRFSTWTVDGPAGTKITFEAEMVRFEPNHLIAWRTIPDQPIEHEGHIEFEPSTDGTRVHVSMIYHPPGGILTHAITHLLGWDPKARLDDDLVRMKSLLEIGRTRAHGERVAISEIH